MKIKSLLFFIFFVSVSIHFISILRVGSVLWGDALYYYAYTRSIVLDQDINFSNEAYRQIGGFPNEPEVSEVTKKVTNKFSPGVSIMWIPGFILGQSIAVILAGLVSVFSLNLMVDLSGYGLVTLTPVSVSAIWFGVVGLYFLSRVLRLLKLDTDISSTLLTLFFATPLFYYMAVDPVNSHPATFMLSAILLFYWVLSLKSGIKWQRTITAGLTAGLLILVRNQDIVLTLPFLLIFLTRPRRILEKVNQLVLFYGSAFVVFSIQLFFTLELYGLFTSPYLHRGEQLHWLQPDFFRVLFSFENGAFFFSPIMLISVLAMVYFLTKKLHKKLKTVIKLSLLTIVLATYVIASWGPEIIGGPYGSRMFVSALPYFGIGIAIFLQLLRKKYQEKYNLIYMVMMFLLTTNMLVQTIVMLVRY